ncbi:MAG: hypothetical protein KTR19_06135, partial [Hyphomicrobiales bacterium]|nr:hypothetical protein [Hyphomicrobiales bacterium]
CSSDLSDCHDKIGKHFLNVTSLFEWLQHSITAVKGHALQSFLDHRSEWWGTGQCALIRLNLVYL